MNTDTTKRMSSITDKEIKRNRERRIAALYQKKAVNHGYLSPVDAAELRDLERKAQS